ncbi:unnamed protein product [Auanema sp. JU1783]|nr:unnamed protein product [Auanema sp. JU1783]
MRSLLVLLAVVVAAYAVVVPPAKYASTAECIMCEIAVKEADQPADKDLKAIENDFIKECEKIIPGKLGKMECQKYANKELGGIIKELESGTAPSDVCHKIHSCPK